jgi:large subunit ribosomal protein L20
MGGQSIARTLAFAKGFQGRANNCIRIARKAVEKSLKHAYKGRKEKRRSVRSAWIQQVNAGSRQYGVRYNQLMHGLQVSNIQLNRKMLAELAENEPYSFKSVVDSTCSIANITPQVSKRGYVGQLQTSLAVNQVVVVDRDPYSLGYTKSLLGSNDVEEDDYGDFNTVQDESAAKAQP